MQVVLHDLLGRQGEPLRDADVREHGLLQDLEEDDVLGAGVLDVVRVRGWDVAHVAGRVVERVGAGGRQVDGDAGGALEEEVPLVACAFVSIGATREREGERGVTGEMPVHFSHGSRLEGDEC